MARAKSKKVHPNAIHLTVASVRRAMQFYQDKLGFKVTATFPDAEKPLWCNLVLGGQAVMLGELPSLQEARQFGMAPDAIELLKQDARAIARGALGTGVAYYVQVPDVDRFGKRMKRKRVKLLTQPKTQCYGIRDCQLADLDGYRLVFFSPVEVTEPPPPPAAPAE
jgi:uncharacterized glyoxalase superfamily protein PhnB